MYNNKRFQMFYTTWLWVWGATDSGYPETRDAKTSDGEIGGAKPSAKPAHGAGDGEHSGPPDQETGDNKHFGPPDPDTWYDKALKPPDYQTW